MIVIETEQGGKTNAVNLGERTLRARGLDLYPRLFLDGDIELVPGSLAAMLAAAQAGESPRIVAARPRFDASRSSLPVRLFYQGEAFNPYHRSGAPNGSGTFMVNAAGRALYFSRRTIPYLREAASRPGNEQLAAFPFLKHLGIYGYRRDTLLRSILREPRTRQQYAPRRHGHHSASSGEEQTARRIHGRVRCAHAPAPTNAPSEADGSSAT